MTIHQEIETLIRARYPLLYVVTSEEMRVQDLLLDISAKRQKQLFEWSCTTGLSPAGANAQSAKTRSPATRDPLAALDEVVAQVEPAIYLFKDLHPFLGKSNVAVTRRLKEIALQLKHSFKTLVIVSPVMEIPVELEKEITVLHFPLPTREDLTTLLHQILAEVGQFKNIAIDLDETGRERLLQAALGLTLGEAENVFAKILVKSQRLSGDDVGEVFAQKQQIIRKSGLLDYSAGEDFSHVGGLDALKEWLVKRALAFTDEARAFGLPAPKGILLLGVQGCGKSLTAKAVASLWQLPLLRFDIGRMFGSLVGSSEENVRRAIAVAESVAPAVLWVDEIDKAFSSAQASFGGDGGTTARVFGTFLTWLSEKESPVFVVATANDISSLPPELLRKGRFDEIFFVDLPGPVEREEIIRIHLTRRGRDAAIFEIPALVGASEGFSGAEIEQAVISALFDAFSARTELATAHLLGALGETVPLSRTMDEQVGRLRSWAQGRARVASGNR